VRLRTRVRWLVPLLLVSGLVVSALAGTAQGAAAPTAAASSAPKVTAAAGFDLSPAMRAVARTPLTAKRGATALTRLERGPATAGRGFSGDAAVQAAKTEAGVSPRIAAPTVNFEGIPATANVPILGGIPIPPDPVGDVGPSQYVEMVNTAWAVYSKTGSLLLGPLSLASIWAGFEVPDCEDNSGDPSWSTTSWPTAGS
jgi:hypothetical protein